MTAAAKASWLTGEKSAPDPWPTFDLSDCRAPPWKYKRLYGKFLQEFDKVEHAQRHVVRPLRSRWEALLLTVKLKRPRGRPRKCGAVDGS